MPENQEIQKNKNLAHKIKDMEPKSKKEYKDLLKFLRQSVTVEELIEDRLAQAFLSQIFRNYPHADRKGSSNKNSQGNPYPTLIHTDKYGGKRYDRGTFMLGNDDDNLYFIPENLLPAYGLRSQDIVAASSFEYVLHHHSGGTSMDYKRPLNRSSIKGGPIQFFNYSSGEWENQMPDDIRNSELMEYHRSEPIDKSLIITAEVEIGVREAVQPAFPAKLTKRLN